MGKFIGELLVPNSGIPPVLVEAAVTVMAADADFVVSAWLVAVTVTAIVEVTDGAVKSPLLDTFPAEDAHVTAVFPEPPTVAVNCCVLPEVSLSLVGEMETDTLVGAVALIAREYCTVLLAPSRTVTVDV
jgi:hypothetical protein